MILGPPTAQIGFVLSRLPKGTHTRFREDMLPALWVAAEDNGIDPVGMIAQSGKETGWGHFGGNVRPEFHNTCGLKLHINQQALFPGTTDGDRPLAHAMFANWRVGAVAQAQHLLAYAGKQVAAGPLIVDPRFELIRGFALTQWSELGGRWAPSSTYGSEIEAIIRTLVT